MAYKARPKDEHTIEVAVPPTRADVLQYVWMAPFQLCRTTVLDELGWCNVLLIIALFAVPVMWFVLPHSTAPMGKVASEPSLP